MFVVIFELCLMCVGVFVLVWVGWLVFGVWDFKVGVVGSMWDVFCDWVVNYWFEVVLEVRAEECLGLLIVFFEVCRFG